jgi:transcriptional regulator with XRE-family HTH domain
MKQDNGGKVTQEAFAALLGVSRSAVANWESGVGVPDMQNLIAIAQVSGMSFEYLATGRGERFIFDRRVAQELPAYLDENTVWNGDELQLLKRYRSSSEERKKAIMALLR